MQTKIASRREFLQRTTVAAGAIAVGPSIACAKEGSPNDTIRVGIVGTGGRGSGHVDRCASMGGVRVVALCDADSRTLAAQLKKFDKGVLRPEGYEDVRKLLDRKDIDAVVTATPNHWHALLTVWACQAGKDVYVEKPISHEIWEGRKAVEAARKYKRIVQGGTQSRSNPALREAFEYLRGGNLGRIRLVRGFCYKRRNSIGKVAGPPPIPSQVNYDLWCGPAPREPLMRKNLHYDWHWVWPTGNGDLGNQGVHEMDMCRWVLGVDTLPVRVVSLGGRFGYVDDGQTPNSLISFFDYQPAPILFETRGLPEGKDKPGMDQVRGVSVGLVVECENGYFAGGAGGGAVYDPHGKVIRKFSGSGKDQHMANFIQAVRSRKVSDLTADIQEGHLSAALCHLGNISYRLGRQSTVAEATEAMQGNKDVGAAFQRLCGHLQANEVDLAKALVGQGPMLTFDPKAERFTGELSEKANSLARREYREPFVIREEV